MKKDSLKALRVLGKHRMEIQTFSVPEIGSSDVLVQVTACGICGTDRHILHGEYPAKYPVIIGHEFCGRVIGVGDKVEEVKIGDSVSINPNIVCGSCANCREGTPHLCERMVALGVDLDGGLAPYCRVPASQIYKLDPDNDLIESCLAEPLSCILHGIDRLGVLAGTKAVVFGGGFIGQLMAQMLKLQGTVRVVIVEPQEHKRQAAKKLGFETIDPASKQGWRELDSLHGWDVTVDCAGAGQVLEECVRITRSGGRILLFAAYPKGKAVSIVPHEIFRKELEIIGSFTYPDTQIRALRLLSSKKLDLEPIIRKISLNDAPKLLNGELDHTVIKGVVTFE